MFLILTARLRTRSVWVPSRCGSYTTCKTSAGMSDISDEQACPVRGLRKVPCDALLRRVRQVVMRLEAVQSGQRGPCGRTTSGEVGAGGREWGCGCDAFDPAPLKARSASAER